MKKNGLEKIRNQRLPRTKFRSIAHALSLALAKKTLAKIPHRKRGRVSLILILRSSIAMLPAFLKYFPQAPIGFIGLRRDEKTAIAKKYYENLPVLNKNSVVVIPDPMLATGGTLNQAMKMVMKKGVNPKNIYYAGFIGAQPGFNHVVKIIPKENITLLALDPNLDSKKFIVPGLGDFGDRYFGY